MRVGQPRRAPGRLDVVVRMAPGEEVRVSPAAAERVLALLPGCADHKCYSGAGPRFADEIVGTEAPHLLEHVVLELMQRSGSKHTSGETVWDALTDGPGVYRVSFRCDDERACRRAIKAADAVLRHVLAGRAAPDVEREVARIARARSR